VLTFDCKRSNLQLDLAGLGRAVRLLAAASFDLGRAHRHAGGVQPQVHRRQLAFDVRPMLYTLLGVDLTQIHGLGPYNALKLVSECGTDMSRWPTCKHFTSWLSLARGNKISGGRLEDATVCKPGGGPAAVGRDHPEPDRHGPGRILPPLVRAGRQGQGGDRDGPQDRRPLLQHDALRHAVRRPGRLAL